MTSDTASNTALELIIEAKSDRYDPLDDRWLTQTNELYTALCRDVGGARLERTAVPGAKGTAEAIILALGSAGVFTAAVEFFRAWLGRDRTRSVEISWNVDGVEQKVVMRGDALDLSTLQPVTAAAASRIGGAPWPIPATGPS
jgi:hypothetical protein